MARTLVIFLALCSIVFADEGRKTVGIIGGSTAKVGQFPYQIAMLKWMQMYCGGSILTPNKVLTAAHCTVDDTKNFHILAGAVNYKKPSDGQLKPMASFKPHPSYVKASSGFDVAIVTIVGSFVFNSYVQPVALNYNEADPTGSCIASGWGLTVDGDNGSVPDFMQMVVMGLLTNAQCSQNWGRLPAGTICASAPGKDTCQGDSGGPLVANVGGKMVQVGITSYGAECARPDLPGVYTSVGKYISWIKNN